MDDERMIQCPYNKSHLILESRMPAHLLKCRQQYPCKDFISCPFNSAHEVLTKEFEHHVENCPDRIGFDSSTYIVDDPRPEVDDFHVDLPPTGENWDEEAKETVSYLDVKDEILKKQKIFRVPKGKTKSERKAFIQEEIERFKTIPEKKPKPQEYVPEPVPKRVPPPSSIPSLMSMPMPRSVPRLLREQAPLPVPAPRLAREPIRAHRPVREPVPSPVPSPFQNFSPNVRQPNVQRTADPWLRRNQPFVSTAEDFIPITYGRGYRIN